MKFRFEEEQEISAGDYVLYYHLRHSYRIDETPVLPYAPVDMESIVVNERCRIYWNYSFPTLELVQANKPDIVLLDHQQKTKFVIEFSAPAEVNVVSKKEEKRTKYQELLGQLRRLWPDYSVSLLVMVTGSLGGMRNTLLSALSAIPVYHAATHILAARMQKAKLGIDVENPLYRKCGEAVETAKHVIFDCPALCRRRSLYLEVVQEDGRQTASPPASITSTNELLSSTTNRIHSFADDSTLHVGIMSNRPISVVELECRRLATAATLSKDLEAITAWGLKNMVEFNASKIQYYTLSNKRCPSEHSVLMNNHTLPRGHSLKLLGFSITENMIWHEHVSSIATAAGKKLGYLFRARKYF
nr:unnamed protein product [Callosobruchus chinensis]